MIAEMLIEFLYSLLLAVTDVIGIDQGSLVWWVGDPAYSRGFETR